MKKLILFTAFILIVSSAYGQNLQKGNLVGTHVMTITPNSGVTVEQISNYMIKTYIPEFQKVRPEWKGYMTRGIRGENVNSVGMIIVIKSEKDRDKYYNSDGTVNELGKKANEKMKPFDDEVAKLGTWTTKYTDWVIQ
jgi:hypothetical protein